MVGKVISGSSFSGTVGYVMKEKSRILEAEGIVPKSVWLKAGEAASMKIAGLCK